MIDDPGRTYDQPLKVEIHDGEVVITGPAAAGFALTPQAAAQTARRLAQAAQQAAEAAGLRS